MPRLYDELRKIINELDNNKIEYALGTAKIESMPAAKRRRQDTKGPLSHRKKNSK